MKYTKLETVIKLLYPDMKYLDLIDTGIYFRDIPDYKFSSMHAVGGATDKSKGRFDVDKYMKKQAKEQKNDNVDHSDVKVYKHKYTHKGDMIIIKFKYVELSETVTFSIGTPRNDTPESCITVVIEKMGDKSYAHIKNLSYYSDCNIDIENISGSLLFDVAIDLIMSLQSKYRIIGIQVADNSEIRCPKRGESNATNNINLALMSTLTRGTTWYGSRGFKPGKYGVYEKTITKQYKRNAEIMAKVLTRDIPIYEMIKANNPKLSPETLKTLNRFMQLHADDLLSTTLTKLLEPYDKTCIIFRSIYRQIADLLHITDFQNKVFYRKI